MLLANLGAGCLLAGLVLCLFAALLSFWSGVQQWPTLARVARRAFYATAATLVLAAAALEAALLTHDFTLTFVAEHTDTQTPVQFLASAFYAGQEGSLLYWTLALAVLGSVALGGTAGVRLPAYATGWLAAIVGFFLLVMNFVDSPFQTLVPTPPNGLGLNPLLRDQGMLVHPPFLLAGFSSFAIPFAFAAAALLAGSADRQWLAWSRRWALVSWGLMGVGLTLGMWWSYHVLGWGGYWSWDPVENVALLPWLVTTAYIHSAQVEENRGLFRTWNLGLLVLAFCLSVFGTFVVRSGVIQSVHSFAVSPIGPWFLGFLAACVIASLLLLGLRGHHFRTPGTQVPPVSREGALLLNNLVLLGLVFAIFWGTMLPLVSGLATGRQAIVGAGFYDRVVGPPFLGLLALLAIGPLLPWRGAGEWRGRLWVPAAAGVGGAVGLAAVGARSPVVLAVAAVVAAGLTTSVGELYRAGFRPRLLANRRRWGAYLAHVGLLLLAIGIAGSQLAQQHATFAVRPGQTATVLGYPFRYEGASLSRVPDGTRVTARVRLGASQLQPSRTVYPALGEQSASGIAILSSPFRDVYLVLAYLAPDQTATFNLYVNPLVTWIWAGAALMILGLLFGNLRWEPGPAGLRERAADRGWSTAP